MVGSVKRRELVLTLVGTLLTSGRTDAQPRNAPGVSATEIKQFSQLHTFLAPGCLLDGLCRDGVYADNWARASAASSRGG